MQVARNAAGWFFPILAVLLGILVAARQLDFPNRDLWTDNPWITPIIFGLTVATLGYQAVRDRVLIARLNRQEKDAYARQMAQHLWTLVFREAGERIPMTDLAVHVWRPSKRFPMFGDERLEKLASFRLHQRASISIEWVKGKGVVGQCWERNRDRWFNLAPVQAAIAAGTLQALPERERLGMSDEEILRGDAYWAIYATPLKDTSGSLIGIVSIDSSKKDSFEDLFQATNGNLFINGAVRVIEKAVS